MALFGDDDGKTEKPTPQRLQEVRQKGDTPLSRELVHGGVLLLAAIALLWAGDWLFEAFGALLRRGLLVDLAEHDVSDVTGAVREMLAACAIVLPPFGTLFLVLIAATCLLGYGQIGLHWSDEVIGFKLERLNPIANFRKLFNVQALAKTGFAVVQLAALLLILWLVIGGRLPGLLMLHEQDLAVGAREVGRLVLLLLLWVSAFVTAIAVVDYYWQRWRFEKRHMMTKQEIEDERKRSEGDPAIRSRQRRARTELMKSRMMRDVPKADVVITNPTHFSVALRYDRSRDVAPVVVAKGVDEIALHIRTIAKENGVPLMEDPPLARALYRAVKVGQGIPERFYQAVATVLGHVFRLKRRTA